MIKEKTIMRVARPTNNLDDISRMYQQGLGYNVLGRIENHNGFDGIIIGHSNHSHHLEFTHHRGTKVAGATTSDNLLIFYIDDANDWRRACDEMASAGFTTVPTYNPYWDNVGNTFEDIDGYRFFYRTQFGNCEPIKIKLMQSLFVDRMKIINFPFNQWAVNFFNNNFIF